MAIYIKINSKSTPTQLLAAIYKAIEDGEIKTWKCTPKKNFVHDTADKLWVNEAYLHPYVEEEAKRLVLGFNCFSDKEKLVPTKRAVYGVLHGRFIEMMLNHFQKEMEVIWPSIDLDTKYDNAVFSD